MAFKKTGSPRPIEVLNNKCQKCGVNKAAVIEDGNLICSSCRDKSTNK